MYSLSLALSFFVGVSLLSHVEAKIGSKNVKSPPATAASVCHVSNVFGDHMVLQRDKPAKVYGFANPGVLVTVSLNGVSVPAVTADNNGVWRTSLPPQPATTTPSTLSFSCSDGTIPSNIVDVLFGDVHICSGVSILLVNFCYHTTLLLHLNSKQFLRLLLSTSHFFYTFRLILTSLTLLTLHYHSNLTCNSLLSLTLAFLTSRLNSQLRIYTLSYAHLLSVKALAVLHHSWNSRQSSRTGVLRQILQSEVPGGLTRLLSAGSHTGMSLTNLEEKCLKESLETTGVELRFNIGLPLMH